MNRPENWKARESALAALSVPKVALFTLTMMLLFDALLPKVVWLVTFWQSTPKINLARSVRSKVRWILLVRR